MWHICLGHSLQENKQTSLINIFHSAITPQSQYCTNLGSMTHFCPATRTECFAPTFRFFPVITNLVPPDKGPYFGVKSWTSGDCKINCQRIFFIDIYAVGFWLPKTN